MIAITVSLREAATPLVVSVLPAQRRLAVEVSSAITTQSSQVAAGQGPLDGLLRRLSRVMRPASCAVLRILTPRMSTAGQPWLTGATWPGWPLPQLNAPPST